jgi:hypothetical protein
LKPVRLKLIMVVFFHTVWSYGQISPGDLSQPHADLEGMSNCTQCHDLGDKVSNAKCLDCHTEIQSLIDKNDGYHASSDVANQNCFKCHSEHHGRKFDMVRFDQDNFDHILAGYKLEGQHNIIDCRDCHKPDYIESIEIRKKEKTFLGLQQACLSCHEDYHQNTLPIDCKQCHDFEAFQPATNFDHSEDSDFALEGKHIEVECIECHQKTTRNGLDFQEFSDIVFTDCKSCHDDPHNNKLPGDCKACHTENTFNIFQGKGQFDHNNTSFTLKGKHKSIDCFECHKETDQPLLVFQDNLRIDENDCVKCHDDKHEGKFGLDCAKCHTEKSFVVLKNMDFFDHSVTDYPLEGKHIEVDCKQCHKGRFTEEIDFSACKNCHEDYHENEFSNDGVSPDCIECHSLNEGFGYSLYTLEQHQETAFSLEGAHIATPCYACHISEDDERWTFRNLGSECVDCHQDIHENYISETFYPNQDCKACHINESWSNITFSHDKTDWPLDGAHVNVECRACHFIENTDNNAVAIQKFSNLETNCISCHENIHDDTFAIDGVTDCIRCHVTSSWMPENFDHNTTRFPLEGKHRELECIACHSSSVVNGETEVLYKLNKLECIDCHL